MPTPNLLHLRPTSIGIWWLAQPCESPQLTVLSTHEKVPRQPPLVLIVTPVLLLRRIGSDSSAALAASRRTPAHRLASFTAAVGSITPPVTTAHGVVRAREGSSAATTRPHCHPCTLAETAKRGVCALRDASGLTRLLHQLRRDANPAQRLGLAGRRQEARSTCAPPLRPPYLVTVAGHSHQPRAAELEGSCAAPLERDVPMELLQVRPKRQPRSGPVGNARERHEA